MSLSTDLKIVYAIPSANPGRAEKTLARWGAMGYDTAVVLDPGMPSIAVSHCRWQDPYPGYFPCMNVLSWELRDQYDIIVFGGDDMYPDQTKMAQEIGQEFVEHFGGTLGVMQPIGDTGIPGVDTICGSPWVGKEYLLRSYQGKGPWHHGYRAYYGDQEMKDVAEKLGLLWQRKDIAQYHHHFSRAGGPPKERYQQHNENNHWNPDQMRFFARKREGYPDHELLRS